MDTQRWHHVRSIFEAALDLEAARRSAFVAYRCGEDDDLRREVLSLLAAHDDDAPFLEAPLSADALLLLTQDVAPVSPGARCGPYRIVRELGHGGMGAVYLAERADGQFQQQVAIKFVRPALYQEDLLDRFHHERRILASLHHPHIARLLDGGLTPSDHPYLVMEYVDGLPITQYCEHYGLSIRQRLALFRTVCSAVQYAHQNLIVHRDLKPSNILVTNAGAVKLLDFGLAKLVDDDGAAGAPPTRTGIRPMTPEYASPEQVRGEPVTTASDVYQLGVILYELLTGHRPYEVRGLSPSAMERVICEQIPSRPSTAVLRGGPATQDDGAAEPPPERLRRRLRGDLDTVVLKALHKDPARRYGSAERLGDDLRRHLARLPVAARPDTLVYRLSKFVRRHVVGVAATALVMLALLGGFAAATHQARVAQRRFDQVRALARTLLFDLHDAIRELPGSTTARRMLVTQALTYLDALNREAGGDPSLQLELAEAYERVGEIQGDPHHTNLGDIAGALASYRKAFALREALWRQDPGNDAARHALANSYGRLAVVTSWSGSNDEALTLSRQALDLLAPLLARAPPDPAVQHDAARIRSELGWWLIWAGRIGEGMAHLADAEPVLARLARQQPHHLELHLDLWRTYIYQLDGLKFTGRFEEGRRLAEDKALAHLRSLAQRYPHEARVQYGLHTCLYYLGEMRQGLGDLVAAARAYQESLYLAEAMVAADSTNRKAHEGLGFGYEAFGRVLRDQGRLEEAVAAYRRVLDLRVRLFEEDPRNLEAGNAMANTHRVLCRLLLHAREPGGALGHCRQAVDVLQRIAPVFRNNAVTRGNLAASHFITARVQRALAGQASTPAARRQHLEEARAGYDRGLDILAPIEALGTASSEWEVHPDTARAERAAVARVLAGDGGP